MSMIEFDPEIRKIEEDVVDFLIDSQILFGEKHSSALILSRFITRKDLTQAKLRELTEMSPGTISQELNSLVERGMITEKARSPRGEITYTMDSIINCLTTSFYHSIKDYLKYEKEFKQMRKDLEDYREEFKDQDAYEQIYNLIMIYLRFFPITEKVLEMLNKKQQELENKMN
ncbi:MAG: hypothetical protein BAJALOKI2v1_420023 [Promethearchaeota archaeon]|nr:MAG: hypothetical protein BAJALOKI2v1_420023 [Candidatus Lokiarchaeota archaeon]